MKELIQDKTKCEFEIMEKIADMSTLFEREEWHIAQYKNNPQLLNRSLSALGSNIPAFTGDSWGSGGGEALLKKPVYQYRDGTIVAEYASISDAAKNIGVSMRKVWGSCHGTKKLIKGYSFSFVNPEHLIAYHRSDYAPPPIKAKPPKVYETTEHKALRKLNNRVVRGKRINQYSPEGVFINQYLCIKDAGEKLEIA